MDSSGRCPRLDLVDERPADPPALMVRRDAHLLDVAAFVNEVDQDLSEGSIVIIDGHPGSAVACVAVGDFDLGLATVPCALESSVSYPTLGRR